MIESIPLDEITSIVTQKAKEVLGPKLRNVILYGSYARGEQTEDSDIDIMVLADIDNDEAFSYWKRICEATGDLDLEYNTIVSVQVKNKDFFYEWISVLPFYQNVIKDGVELYGS